MAVLFFKLNIFLISLLISTEVVSMKLSFTCDNKTCFTPAIPLNEEACNSLEDTWAVELVTGGRSFGLGTGVALLLLADPQLPRLSEERRLFRLQRLLYTRGMQTIAGDESTWHRLRLASSYFRSPRPAALLPAGEAGVGLIRRLQPPQGPDVMLISLPRGSTRRLLANVPLRFDSGLLVAQRRRPHAGEFRMLEVWRSGYGGVLELRHLGEWEPSKGLRWDAKPRRRRRARADLKGTSFTAVAARKQLIRFKSGPEDSYIFNIFYDLWETMAKFNNFSTKWRNQNMSIYGGQEDNGSWRGIMGELTSNRADVAVCDMTITNIRKDYVDFLDSVYNTRSVPYIKRRARRSLRWTDFLTPFDGSLWAAAVGAAILLTLGLILVLRTDTVSRMDPRDAWLFMVAALCLQGQCVPKVWSGRLVCMCAYLVALVLAAAHSGSLISSLSAGDDRPIYHSIREALDDPRARFMITGHSGFQDFLENASGEVKEIAEKVKYSMEKTYMSIVDLFDLLCKDDKTIILMNQEYKMQVNRYLSCEVENFPSFFIQNPTTFAARKNIGYTDFLSYFVRRMRRVGVVARMMHRHWPRSPIQLTRWTQPSVQLVGVAPLFLVLSIGALLAVLLLLLERHFK